MRGATLKEASRNSNQKMTEQRFYPVFTLANRGQQKLNRTVVEKPDRFALNRFNPVRAAGAIARFI
jgi:hypothetical protein